MASSGSSSDMSSSSSGSALHHWQYMFSHLFILLPLSMARTSCWKIAIFRFSERSTDGGLPGRIKTNEGGGRADKELVPVMLV